MFCNEMINEMRNKILKVAPYVITVFALCCECCGVAQGFEHRLYESLFNTANVANLWIFHFSIGRLG